MGARFVSTGNLIGRSQFPPAPTLDAMSSPGLPPWVDLACPASCWACARPDCMPKLLNKNLRHGEPLLCGVLCTKILSLVDISLTSLCLPCGSWQDLLDHTLQSMRLLAKGVQDMWSQQRQAKNANTLVKPEQVLLCLQACVCMRMHVCLRSYAPLQLCRVSADFFSMHVHPVIQPVATNVRTTRAPVP